jgi:hypothetical protein
LATTGKAGVLAWTTDTNEIYVDSGTGSAGIGPGNAWQKIVNDVVSVNPQVGTSYTVLSSDRGKLVTLTNAAAIAVTVPQAGVAFPAGWWADFEVLGAGSATFTPTTSTINNGASVSLATKQSFRLVSDGTNYFALLGMTSVAVTNAVAHQFATSNNANGSLNLAQPAFTDISGVLAQTQLPASIGVGSNLTSVDCGTF